MHATMLTSATLRANASASPSLSASGRTARVGLAPPTSAVRGARLTSGARRASLVVRAAEDDVFKAMSKLAKKVQGAIPVVSLVSKLLTPEGGIGVESLSYNEYCRIKLDAAGGTAYGEALSELCDSSKKEPRTLLLLTWMVYEGDGLLPVDQAMSAARRLASTGFDYEYEIYKFEQARDDAIDRARRKGVERMRDQASTADAATAALEVCLGGADGMDDALKERVRIVAEATVSPA